MTFIVTNLQTLPLMCYCRQSMQLLEFTVIFIKHNCFEVKSLAIASNSMLMQNVTLVSWKREKKKVSFTVIYFECDLYSLQANIYLRGKKCNYNVQMAKTLLQIYCEGRKNVLVFRLAGDLFFCYVRAPLCGY